MKYPRNHLVDSRTKIIKQLVVAFLGYGLVLGVALGIADSWLLITDFRTTASIRILLSSTSFSIVTCCIIIFFIETSLFIFTSIIYSSVPRISRVVNPKLLPAALLFSIIVIILQAGLAPKQAHLDVILLTSLKHFPFYILLSYSLISLISRYNPFKCLKKWTASIFVLIILPIVILSLFLQIYYTNVNTSHSWSPFSDTPPPSAGRITRPNILLIVLDTVRADRLGCYGYDLNTTPNIDAFAADALLFEYAIAPGVWTVPTHASLFSGLAPAAHQATNRRPYIDTEIVTLAELMQSKGYETVCLSNNPWISKKTRMDKGFDICLNPREISQSTIRKVFKKYFKHLRLRWIRLYSWFDKDSGAEMTNEIVKTWLSKRESVRPFFLFINYLEVHSPYNPTLECRNLFVEDSKLIDSYRLDQKTDREWAYTLFKDDYMSRNQIELSSNLYDGSLYMLDQKFANLLSILSREIDLDRTVVILTADHGEEIGDHERLGHQYSIYNTLTHIPLMIRYPLLIKPDRRSDPVQLQDLFYTILDIVDIPAPLTAEEHGCSLLNPDRISNAETRYCISEYYGGNENQLAHISREFPLAKLDPLSREFLAIYLDKWKAIIPSDGATRLFNIKEDPEENTDLADLDHSLALSLREKAMRIQEEFQIDRKSDGSGTPESSDFNIEQLRALGYMQ